MEAVGQLTGGLAHDFNNLLTGISGSLELLQIRISQGRHKDVERYISTAQGAANRAAALTHRLLAFSRRQTLDPKATDVNRLVGSMTDLINNTLGPEIEMTMTTAPDLWTTLVDPNQLENALLNLCINARDAMPNGGKLKIETANRTLDGAEAFSFEMRPGDYVCLSVTDTGTGMSEEVVQRAFDPFYTTKPLGQGTGLGLSMIYGFAKQSGGQVRISSTLGRGTTISLFLPRHSEQEQTAKDSTDFSLAPRAGAGETVLIVDDEPSVRMLVAEVLGELGYTAIESADGAECLAGSPFRYAHRSPGNRRRFARRHERTTARGFRTNCTTDVENSVHYGIRGKSGHGCRRPRQRNGDRYEAVCDGGSGSAHEGASAALTSLEQLFDCSGLVEAGTLAAIRPGLLLKKDSNMVHPPGCSVLLVEDEVMIRMMVADMLEELGHRVVGEAGEISRAIALAQSIEFELAILDVNLNGEVITPVAEVIKARKRPLIFATGYGAAGVPDNYRDQPTLQKPFLLEQLAGMIDRALKKPATTDKL